MCRDRDRVREKKKFQYSRSIVGEESTYLSKLTASKAARTSQLCASAYSSLSFASATTQEERENERGRVRKRERERQRE